MDKMYKQKYLIPKMEIVKLETEDIITTSSDSDGCGGGGIVFDGWCISGSTEVDSGNVCEGLDWDLCEWGDND